MIDHEAGLEGVRMVEVEARALLWLEMVEIPVVRVVVEERDPARTEPLHNSTLDRRLAGPRSASDSNDDGHETSMVSDLEDDASRTDRLVVVGFASSTCCGDLSLGLCLRFATAGTALLPSRR